MRSLVYLISSVFIVSLFSCSTQEKAKETGAKNYQQIDFKNALNIQGIPNKPYDLSPFGFSDQGAWHAFGLPHQNSTNYYGAFTGPLLMRMWGTWSGPALFQLQLQNQNGEAIALNEAKAEMSYLPGKLQQQLELDEFSVAMNLIFIDERTSVIQTEILNKTKNVQKLKIGWKGAFFNNSFNLEMKDKQLDFNLKKYGQQLSFITEKETTTTVADTTYSMWEKEARALQPNTSIRFYTVQKHTFEGETEIASAINFEKAFAENKTRWEGYLTKALSSSNPLLKDSAYQRVVVKSVMTLLSNWRSPAGALKHDGVFPSAAYQGFYGFWSWDSWKHAVALVRFHPELAKNSMRSMFDFQDEAGMVADCVYFDPSENNWRDTKAPLSAWAVWEIYEATQDKEFLKEMYPKLERYHKWWYADRDVNKNGLCEYGSTDGTSIAARWESGMDNAVRFDSVTMIKSHDKAFSMDVESVDLNAYLADEKRYLANICHVLDLPAQSSEYTQDAEQLQTRIQEHFYSTTTGFYHDFDITRKQHIEAMGPEGWIPLWTETASVTTAKTVIQRMRDTKRFATFVPFPTLDASHSKFNPLKGYWRGPVWLDQAYFGIKGLEKYGYKTEAQRLTLQLLRNGEGIMTDAPLRENYHPLTGKGLNANHFSWSAAHIFMLLTDEE